MKGVINVYFFGLHGNRFFGVFFTYQSNIVVVAIYWQVKRAHIGEVDGKILLPCMPAFLCHNWSGTLA